MPRILVLNNYPLDALWNAVKRNEAPDQLLFGINFFHASGWTIRLLPVGVAGAWQQLNQWLAQARFPIPFGDLQQQREAWQHLNDCDVIYAACQTQSHILSYLRAFGLVHRPIVIVVHHPVNRGRLMAVREPFLRWQMNGTDHVISLSTRIADRINERSPGKCVALRWGTDLNFYKPSLDPGRGVLAVGRTGRDFATFGLAATSAKVAAKIICLQKNITPDFSRFGDNVEIDVQPDSGWMAYPELVRHYASARVLAIPHGGQESLVGLSSLTDALGIGKPVIMTRHPLVDIDIEAEGIGRWVEPGDIDGWRDAIAWFDAHPEEASDMGHRARLLAENGLNSRSFAEQALGILERSLAGS